MDQSMSEEQRRETVMSVVRVAFKPEFLNRLDDIVFFHALTTQQLAAIVDIQVAALAKRLSARRLTLQVSDEAREWLAIGGFDPLYGARPLRRLIQSEIQDRLAMAILSGGVRDGDVVRVDAAADGSSLVLTSSGPAAEPESAEDDDVIEAELLED